MKKIYLSLSLMLLLGVSAWAQSTMPSWYKADNAPIMQTVKDRLTDVEVYGWIRQDAVKTWGEKVFSVDVDGSPLKYHWFDLDTYCAGDNEGWLSVIVNWYLEKYGLYAEYKETEVYNPNTNLAPDVKSAMKLGGYTLCFTIIDDTDGEFLVVNRYFRNEERFATFISPIYQ
ncbi:hypothetical protein FACS1894109_20160 [Spirochaetia bacterium]|nr:hypothetical protein FACS1894109_20160 [Spirochaetia bacterium]